MASLYFEEAEIGTLRAAGPYLVTKDEIIGLTASGAHTFAITISLLSKTKPTLRVLAGLGWDELRLPTPVRPGDALDLEVVVLERRESKSHSDRGIVRNQMHLRNQKRETVMQCVNTALVARRPVANP